MTSVTIKSLEANPTKHQPVNGKRSAFTSRRINFKVNEQCFRVRITNMQGSTLIFICHANPECLNEMAVAMPMPPKESSKTTQSLGTTIIGDPGTSASQRLAEQLSLRFKRQFIVSYNVNLDPIVAPKFERALSDYIRMNTDAFIKIK